MCVRKISGFVLMWGLTRSSLLRSQIFYVYRPRPPAFRYVPIVRGSGVSEQGVPLFAGLSRNWAILHPKTGMAGGYWVGTFLAGVTPALYTWPAV